MSEVSSSQSITKCFIKELHYDNLTVLYLVQNVYYNGKSQRTISINSHYNAVSHKSRDAI